MTFVINNYILVMLVVLSIIFDLTRKKIPKVLLFQ